MAVAHGGKHKEQTPGVDKPDQVKGQLEQLPNDLLAKRLGRMQEINRTYLERIKPIFRVKCFNCHSTSTIFPWYYKIPGIKQLIDDDIAEGLEHLDLTDDFPFKGHGSPKEDLEVIAKSVEKSEMPPWNYLLMNRDHRLSPSERLSILDWTKSSRKTLDE
jgi:hypothetical protein